MSSILIHTSKIFMGEGFLLTGRNLEGDHIPQNEVERRARAGTEVQSHLKQTVGLSWNIGSSQKLGGASVDRGQDRRQNIADAATRG